MEFLINQFGVFYSWLIAAFLVFGRYALLAGLTFLFFYKIKKKRYLRYKIQAKFPSAKKVKMEGQHSFITAFIFALAGLFLYFMRQQGWTSIYLTIEDYGWIYFLSSFILLLVIHDTYFYWVHRLMHHPSLFVTFHSVHHQSHNPTPWAALSFHPLEAVVEIAIVPIMVIFIPFHPIILIVFGMVSLAFNILGHLGFELFPKWFVRHPFFKWFNTSTHHNMHHSKAACNYGLYFNFWDRVMGTNHKDYEVFFESRKENSFA